MINNHRTRCFIITVILLILPLFFWCQLHLPLPGKFRFKSIHNSHLFLDTKVFLCGFPSQFSSHHLTRPLWQPTTHFCLQCVIHWPEEMCFTCLLCVNATLILLVFTIKTVLKVNQDSAFAKRFKQIVKYSIDI